MNNRTRATRADCAIGSWLWTDRVIDTWEGTANGFVRVFRHSYVNSGGIHIRFMGMPKVLGGKRGQEQEIPWNLVEIGNAGLYIPLPGEIATFVENEKRAAVTKNSLLTAYVKELGTAPTT